MFRGLFSGWGRRLIIALIILIFVEFVFGQGSWHTIGLQAHNVINGIKNMFNGLEGR